MYFEATVLTKLMKLKDWQSDRPSLLRSADCHDSIMSETPMVFMKKNISARFDVVCWKESLHEAYDSTATP